MCAFDAARSGNTSTYGKKSAFSAAVLQTVPQILEKKNWSTSCWVFAFLISPRFFPSLSIAGRRSVLLFIGKRRPLATRYGRTLLVGKNISLLRYMLPSYGRNSCLDSEHVYEMKQVSFVLQITCRAAGLLLERYSGRPASIRCFSENWRDVWFIHVILGLLLLFFH
jgi:hypothetical protein